MALVTLSVLFLFRLPEVSRLLLLVLFPAQAVATIVDARGPARVLERYRRRGNNLRFVLVLGAGPRGQAFAAKLEGHRELGLRVIGFLDADPADRDERSRGRCSARSTTSRPSSTPASSTRSRSASRSRCGTGSTRSPGLCEEEGKIVRIPMDVMDRAISAGRVEELDGTPVFSLVSGPDRALALAAKRGLDLAGRRSSASSSCRRCSPSSPSRSRSTAAGPCCSARPASASTGARSRSSSSARWSSTPRRAAPSSPIATRSAGRCSSWTPTRA